MLKRLEKRVKTAAISSDTPENDTRCLQFNIASLKVPTKEVIPYHGVKDLGRMIKAKCSRRKPTGYKQILSNISGTIQQGQMVALMGASGAGKSTLLGCLSGQNSSFQGFVRTRGVKSVGFVKQDDLFIPILTVLEHMKFHTRLRMGYKRTVEAVTCDRRAEALLKEFGLAHTKNTLIGGGDSFVTGLSGGERKRLALATEIIVDVDFMLADEPTSGLDSFTSEVVVRELLRLATARADGGRIVVATIHSPSSTVIGMFTHIMLLSKGRLVHYGTLDETLRFFAVHGHVCPMHHNPAEYFIDILADRGLIDGSSRVSADDSGGGGGGGDGSDALVSSGHSGGPITNGMHNGDDGRGGSMNGGGSSHHIGVGVGVGFSKKAPDHASIMSEAFLQSRREVAGGLNGCVPGDEGVVSLLITDDNGESGGGGGGGGGSGSGGGEHHLDEDTRQWIDVKDFKKTYMCSSLTQWLMLMWRARTMYSREPVLFQARIIQSVFQGVILGFIFFQMGMSQSNVQTRSGALFFSIFNQTLISAFSVVLSFAKEARVFLRENAASVYSLGTYFLSRTLIDVPYQSLFTTIFAATVYWMMGLRQSPQAFAQFMLTIIVSGQAGASIGYAVSLISLNVTVGLAVCPVILFPMVLLGGFFVNTADVPIYARWIETLSPFSYAFESLMIVEWAPVQSIPCKADEYPCAYNNGDDVLDYYNLSSTQREFWLNTFGLFLLTACYRVLAFLLLWYHTNTVKNP